jgi:hypothetical protein
MTNGVVSGQKEFLGLMAGASPTVHLFEYK